jgi:hypothetical protein
MLDIAQRYLASGLAVLPAKRSEKRPTVAWKKYQQRLPSAAELSQWFSNGNADAYCLLTGEISGHLELLDFDCGGELFPAWLELAKQVLPESVLSRLVIESSQSGGKHVIYRCSSKVCGNVKLAARTVTLDSGEQFEYCGKVFHPRQVGEHWEVTIALIETRGEGGLFLCHPSQGYQLEQGDFASIPILSEEQREDLLAAAWSLNEVPAVESGVAMRALPDAEQRPGDWYNENGDIRDLLLSCGWTPQGSRDDNEHWARPGKSEGTSATLRERCFYCFTSNAPPLEPNKAYAPFALYTLLKCGGDYRKAAADIAEIMPVVTPTVVVDLSELLQPHHKQHEARDPGPLPIEWLRCPGFVSELMDFALDTAPYPNVTAAFCGALTMQGWLAGRKVRDEGDNRTNLYTLCLAQSASGKDWIRKINVKLACEVGISAGIADRFASGEGIQDALYTSPSMLFQTDEIDGLLLSITRARDARHEAIITTLLNIFTSASTAVTMRKKSGGGNNDVIDQPCLCIFGTATPEYYYESLSDRMFSNGFFARWLTFQAEPRGRGQEAKIMNLPKRIIETAAYWAHYKTGYGNLVSRTPSATIIEADQSAKDILNAFRVEADREYSLADINDHAATSTWGRANEHARKLALLYAISSDHKTPWIDVDAALWATRLAGHLTRQSVYAAHSNAAANAFHGDCLKAVKKIREAGGILAHSVLLKRMKCDTKHFAELVKTLSEQNEIETVSEAGSRKPTTYYRITSP